MKKKNFSSAGAGAGDAAVRAPTHTDVKESSTPSQCVESLDGTAGTGKKALVTGIGAKRRRDCLVRAALPEGTPEGTKGSKKIHRVDETGGLNAEEGTIHVPSEKRSSFSSCQPDTSSTLHSSALSLSTHSSGGTGPGFAFKEKKGIIYICRIPPRMSRTALRRYFERFGRLGRLHITGDEEKARGKKRGFTNRSRNSEGPKEGWLEFEDKKVARRVVRLLDGQMVGGKKRKCRWREDLWGLKYLRGFTWQQLVEEKVYKHRVREAKLNAALSQVKKENTLYLELVEEQKRILKMEEKRKRKAERDEGRAAEAGEGLPGSRGDPAEEFSNDDGDAPAIGRRESRGQECVKKKKVEKTQMALRKKRIASGVGKTVETGPQDKSREMLKVKIQPKGTRAISDAVLDQFVL